MRTKSPFGSPGTHPSNQTEMDAPSSDLCDPFLPLLVAIFLFLSYFSRSLCLPSRIVFFLELDPDHL